MIFRANLSWKNSRPISVTHPLCSKSSKMLSACYNQPITAVNFCWLHMGPTVFNREGKIIAKATISLGISYTYNVSPNKLLKLEHYPLTGCNGRITPWQKCLLCSWHRSFKLFICGQRNLRNNFLCCLSSRFCQKRLIQETFIYQTQFEKKWESVAASYSTHRVYDIDEGWWSRINKTTSDKIRNPLHRINKRISNRVRNKLHQLN